MRLSLKVLLAFSLLLGWTSVSAQDFLRGDADGDGRVVPLADAGFILDWAFNDQPEPPDPGPTDCGVDPEDDDVTCDESPEECE